MGRSDRPDRDARPHRDIDGGRSIAKPWLVVSAGITRPSDVAEWLAENDVRVLNVAGNRESLDPGIGDRVGAFLIRLFRLPGG